MTEDDRQNRNSFRDAVLAILGASGVTITYCSPLLGGWNVIWYWGKETSFAGGKSVEEIVASIERQVFGGL